MPKVFDTVAPHYAQRPGGYTRIHKFGHRPGDNAPHAVLELVDGRDIMFEMAARATGWDVLSSRLKTQSARSLVKEGVRDVEETVERERARGEGGEGEGEGEGERGELRQRTLWNVRKVLRYRSAEDVERFGEKVQGHMVRPCSTLPHTHHHLLPTSHTPTSPSAFSPPPCRTRSSHGLWLSKPSASTQKRLPRPSRIKNTSAALKISS